MRTRNRQSSQDARSNLHSKNKQTEPERLDSGRKDQEMKKYIVTYGTVVWSTYTKRKDAEEMKRYLNSRYKNGYKVIVEEA